MSALQQTDREALERRSLEAAQVNLEPSLTLQGPAHDADINVIARSFGLGRGPMPVPPEVFDPRHYGDMSEVPSLQEALDLVREAENSFMRLPPELRKRFNDAPAALWEFVQDPNNWPEAVRLGLLKEMAPEGAGSEGKGSPETTPGA